MLGADLGLVSASGPAMLLLVPAPGGVPAVVTALTYQFQGWLASLMANKRRRRTVIVVVTMSFILIFQLPNLINILQPWERHAEATANLQARAGKLDREPWPKADRRRGGQRDMRGQLFRKQNRSRGQERRPARGARSNRWAGVVNLVCRRAGWPYGGDALRAGRGTLPALVAMLAMTLIGVASLRALPHDLRLYTRPVHRPGKGSAAPSEAAPKPATVAVGHGRVGQAVGSRGRFSRSSCPGSPSTPRPSPWRFRVADARAGSEDDPADAAAHGGDLRRRSAC